MIRSKFSAAFVLIMFLFNLGLSPVMAQIPTTQPAPREPGLFGKSTNDQPPYKAGGSSYDNYFNKVPVHVFGAVSRPGTYKITPADRVTDVLTMAEGLLENGSERFIEIRRGGKKIINVDLFLLRREGALQQNAFLQSNDVIFVPYQKEVVSIYGPVNLPGKYELFADKNLYDLIHKAAGGFSTGFDTASPINVIRYATKNTPDILPVTANLEDLKSFQLISGDVIQIPHKFNMGKKFDYSVGKLPNDHISYPSYTEKVFVLGGVKMPQAIPYDPRNRISSYVALAAGKDRLGRNDVEIMRIDGTKVKSKIYSDTSINPGDTIIVKQDKLGPEFWISLMVSIASLGVTSYAILKN